MRYKVFGLILALAATVTSAAAARADTIHVTPSSGNQYKTFTFTGNGFVPGDRLDVALAAPNGDSMSYGPSDSTSLVVGRGGNFSISLTPYSDLAGEPAGTWGYAFCSELTFNCYYGNIQVTK